VNKDRHITKADLADKKITRIDVFYDNGKSPILTLSPQDGKRILASFIRKMLNENEG
jgi:ethanolamine utilization protein EutP (predicted NTPase)